MTATAGEREQLRKIIQQWNENRLDLFALSAPNEELEFHGVMRFYFHETGQRVVTKCVRVSSTATARAVVDALVEKFHPDMRMLTLPSYSLWELHENGDRRLLAADEKPLLVQLNWHKDDREGRFLLQQEGADLYMPLNALNGRATDAYPSSMKRKLSRRERREQKKQQRREEALSRGGSLSRPLEAEDVGSAIYSHVPPTSFTRTISNPEIVMKKRRERKLEQKLREMGEGGSLKIYGTELDELKPYVTLLVSMKDRVDKILKEALEKYGLDRQDPADFCLCEVILPATPPDSSPETLSQLTPTGERVMGEDECPLLVLAQRPPTATGSVVFHVRRRPDDAPPPSRRPVSAASQPLVGPALVQLHADGSETTAPPKVFRVEANVTEVGSDRCLADGSVQSLPLFGPYVHPRHCVLAYMDGVVTLTPSTATAEILVNGRPISATTILHGGCTIRIGRSHVFRFVDAADAARAHTLPPSSRRGGGNDWAESDGDDDAWLRADVFQLETTFDLDGAVQTRPRSPAESDDAASAAGLPLFNAVQRRSLPVAQESIPAIVELPDSTEDEFLSAVTRHVDTSEQSFKFAAAYVLYMGCRYRLSPHYRTSLLPDERAERLRAFLAKTASLLHVAIQDHCHNAPELAYWMTNTAELLNFVKHDCDLGPVTRPEPQETLADAVAKAFDHLTSCLREDVGAAMDTVLDGRRDHADATDGCLRSLAGAMSLLRSCRANAALTIQLFSQLFHYINMYLFNWLVSREGASYCTRAWGAALSARLHLIHAWAHKQGLEMAAECHLDRISQAAKLLTTAKSMSELATLGSTCYKLNSLQVLTLLERYVPAANEAPVDRELVENVARLAEMQADELIRADGRSVQVEEEVGLQLPFLLPDDGYSTTCEAVRAVPAGLHEFVNHLHAKGVCRMVLQPSSSGLWSVHLTDQLSERVDEDVGMPSVSAQVVRIAFHKGESGIGLSIVAAQGAGESQLGIYVKKIVVGSAAERDGRLQSGDRLLAVNGHNLTGISQEDAAYYMAQSGATVTFDVAKGAASLNGLAAWLQQPSPHVQYNTQQMRAPPPNVYRGADDERLRRSVGDAYHPINNGSAPPRLPSIAHQRYGSVSAIGSRAETASPMRGPLITDAAGRQAAQPSQRSLSASNLVHESQQRADAFSMPVVRPAPPRPLAERTEQLPRVSAHGSMSGGPAMPVSYQNLDAYRRQEQMLAASSVEQPPTNSLPPSRRYERKAQPSPSMTRSAENYLHANGRQSPSALRRPPSADERVYRAQAQPSPSASLVSSVFEYPPRQSGSPKTLSPSAGEPRVAHFSTAHSVATHQPQMPPPQEPYWQSPPQQPSSPSPPAVPQPYLPTDGVVERQSSRQYDKEVLRLMEEELSRLEMKEHLSDSEERRFRALKYEVAYQSRLEEAERSQRNSAQSTSSDVASPGAEMGERRQLEHERYYAQAEQKIMEQVAGDHHVRTHTVPAEPPPDVHEQMRKLAVDASARGNGERPAVSPPQVPPKRVAVARAAADTTRYAQAARPVEAPRPAEPPRPVEAPRPHYIFALDGAEAPRAEVIGTHEVYLDPRQERLHRLEQMNAQQRTKMDGAHLGFREKMQMFAQQIGDATPRDRMKASSAQRDIETPHSDA